MKNMTFIGAVMVIYIHILYIICTVYVYMYVYCICVYIYICIECGRPQSRYDLYTCNLTGRVEYQRQWSLEAWISSVP